jgi:hypothetical protein
MSSMPHLGLLGAFSMPIKSDPRLGENLRRWIASGQPRRWVESRLGHWDHADWLVLLGNLRHTEFWPMDPEAIGAVLEQLRQAGCHRRAG